MSEVSGAASTASQNQNNTTIGIVIPTQPIQHNDTESFSSAFSMPSRVVVQRNLSSSSSQNQHLNHQTSNSSSRSVQQQHHPHNLPPRATVEDKLSQIQEYIKITSSLLNSMQVDDVSNFLNFYYY